ncbi:MAG: D-erythronate dehydrogenase [Paracoccaceae bacterium]
MHVLVTGAAGMLGRRIVAALVARGRLGDARIERLTLQDVVEAAPPDAAEPAVGVETGDLAAAGTAERLIAGRPDVVLHLGAVVSGEAEQDFEKGYRVNFDGTRALLEAIRRAGDGYRPRFVFASSIAVFGAPLPDVIDDDFHAVPLTSYGAQKAMGELLVTDYTRRVILDGASLRLPTVCVRPGAPNKAASGFFSGIIREPLNGERAVLPVDEDVRHWMVSPRSAAGFFLHAAEADLSALGPRRALNMPGVSVTVAEEIEALRRVGGDDAVALIERRPDPAIEAMVGTWARGFDARRARDAGFTAEDRFDEIVDAYVEEELGGRVPVRER